MIKQLCGFATVVLLACLTWFVVFATGGKSSARTQITTGSLTIKLEAENQSLCRGSQLSVSAKITNTGAESLAIDPQLLWSCLSFTASSRGKSGRAGIRTRTEIGDPDPSQDEPDYLVLRPGETFRETKSLSLKDDFFQMPGKYLMQLTYRQFREAAVNGVSVFVGTVPSNEIKFEVIACGKRRGNI
jgi:hypothetical protein